MKNSMILWAVSSGAAVSLAVACGSSSNPTTPAPATDASMEDTGAASSSGGGSGSSSGGADAMGGVTCMNAAGCPSGQVCCATVMMTTSCQAGPCPSTAIGPIQLCATPAECSIKTDTVCGPIPLAPTLPVKECQAGDGGTTTTEAGPTEAGPTEAGPTEAGPTDSGGAG
jgi:hypothetical protein